MASKRAARTNFAVHDGPRTRTESVRRVRSKREATERLVAADSRLAEELPLREVDLIVKESERAVALIDADEPRLSAVTGEPLQPAGELARQRKQNLFRAFAERRRLLSQALTATEVADLLSASRQTPHDRAKAGTLLAIKDSGRLLFPDWQFDPDGPDGVVAGLPAVLGELRGPLNQLAKARWFLTQKSLMQGLTPLEALRAGDLDDVLAEARSVGAS